ncbi:hypothetical protein E3N88_31166 [Mikania micrantha]|uniref:Uncharacterized protein n=1 Tax=Mikania micrantha TaxID=192012 RepID=A0A5N6MPH3_9ASTR|nr:hypothetical protein E3N88_31166 [Mikania micrantha]
MSPPHNDGKFYKLFNMDERIEQIHSEQIYFKLVISQDCRRLPRVSAKFSPASKFSPETSPSRQTKARNRHPVGSHRHLAGIFTTEAVPQLLVIQPAALTTLIGIDIQSDRSLHPVGSGRASHVSVLTSQFD